MPKILLAVALIARAASAVAEPALYHNFEGYTSSANGLMQFSVLVVDDSGRISAVGDDELLADYPALARIDLGGRYLLPGLIDAHAHVLGLGQLRSRIDLTGVATLEAALGIVADYAETHRHRDWLVGRGWNQVLWPGNAFPEAADLDGVVADRPVWLRRIDGHAGWANTAALTLAGIDADTPDPQGGKIVRDANGHATGILIDTAMHLVEQHQPADTRAEVHESLQMAFRELQSLGVTGVHDAGIDLATAEVYLSMADNEQLGVRIVAMAAGTGEVLDTLGKPLRGLGNDRLDIAAVKLVADGALGSRGAAMLEPYADDAENRGLRFWSSSELDAQVDKAHRLGFQVAIHAIGDAGNRMALDALERVQQGRPSARRHRIEHAQIIAPDDLPRFAALGVVAAMQTVHATSDKNMAEDRIGAGRMPGAYAWRTLLDSGVVIANGSDFPVELANPFHGLFAAVTRQSRDNEPPGGWYPEQAMSREEALHSYTLAAAYAARQEDRLGSLEPGKWADFILVDRDYFSVPAEQIDDIRVLGTWIGGERVYPVADPRAP